ncbi:MAG: glutamine-hydrolyzing carbamoyl-phosphate synthase small subunit [Muribaculaceae bacterium]|nr:glutamine-hydrolyzing carbamoyl-phosphate synthase small subunit [Muribaculaceae bacterium]
MKKATLILDDGTRFEGESFGYEGNAYGEVVFNTAMTGYPEALTDPSYAGQIMVLTYPLVGNYGVPSTSESSADGIERFMESDRIYPTGLIVGDYSEQFSHWNAQESLSEWLRREKVPGITGIDTRRLTQLLREHGVMMGRIYIDGATNQPEETDYNKVNYVDLVSVPEVRRYGVGDGRKKVAMIDCGAKNNIIRCLVDRGVEVIRVPWNYDFNNLEFDGLFISNGPGNPEACAEAVENIRKFIDNPEEKRPLMGICMGNQLLAKAAGATIYKLKYGHRSHNQPVRMEGTERCFITSQNHGFAVEPSTLRDGWEPYFTNMNDGSNEGIRHREKPWFSSQFHPEASGGPVDTEFLFDDFIKLL